MIYSAIASEHCMIYSAIASEHCMIYSAIASEHCMIHTCMIFSHSYSSSGCLWGTSITPQSSLRRAVPFSTSTRSELTLAMGPSVGAL